MRFSCSRVLRAALLALLPGLSAPVQGHAAPVYGYRVAARLPHSTSSFTEGFFFKDGLFYEGTGLKGRSSLLVEQPQNGAVLQRLDLPPQYFGEGIVDWGSTLYEWTWQSHTCFVYDRFTLKPLRQMSYEGEGWGMTRTSSEIITSDGTSVLRFRDPSSFHVTREISVKDEGKPVEELNELEYIHGEIYANVWHENRIARISPRDGRVLSWIDLSGLLPANEKVDDEAVLNGIAYDAEHDRLFVTGKEWPAIFEIKVDARPRSTKP